MTELSPMNMRAELPGTARHTGWSSRDVRHDKQRAGERFVAVRPASLPAPSLDPGSPYEVSAAGSRPPLPPATSFSRPPRRSELPAGNRVALLVGTSIYDHAGYPELPIAGAGIRHMQHVLERPDIGMMDACMVIGDATREQMVRGLETFLDERQYGDNLLVYLSGYAGISCHDGRLFFVAKDTDPKDLEGTAVSADFFSRLLQECQASSKVALLDYCEAPPARDAGSPAMGPGARTGARSGGRSGVRGRDVMPEPAGVYVIAAAETLQRAPAQAPTALGTSRFTGEIVDALRAGRVKAGLGPWVTADDLSGYLVEQTGRLGVAEGTRPGTSTLAVTGNHVIARSAVRALSLLNPHDLKAERRLPATGHIRSAQESGRAGANVPNWRPLIAYYRACLADARSPRALSSRSKQSVSCFQIASGAEVLLSGLASTMKAPEGVNTFDLKEHELWYGYPMVTVAGGGRRHSASPVAPVMAAPLLVQRVDTVVDPGGQATLRPTGPIMPHAGVLRACLDDQEANSVLASWRQSWRGGDSDQLLVVARQLIKRLGLTELEPLNPSSLSAASFSVATRTGAHNAAGVLVVESTRPASLRLSAELGAVSDAAAKIPATALEHLARPGAHRGAGTPRTSEPAAAAMSALLVTPDELNERHEEVIGSAMTRPLTVATAPPGSGKDRLIVDLVATAVAAGQKILVVSPDSCALREVTERCDQLAPGLLIKTGDAKTRAEEKQLLRQLLSSSASDSSHRPSTIVADELTSMRAQMLRWRRQLAMQVELETRLRKTCSARTAAAGRLGLSADALATAWSTDDEALQVWVERARGLVAGGVLGSWRARREVTTYFRATAPGVLPAGAARRLVAEPEALEPLVLFGRAELQLRKDRRSVLKITDDQLDEDGRAIARKVRQLSEELLVSVTSERVAAARPRLQERRRSLEPGGRSRPESQRELMRHLGGWAVAGDAAGQLAMEAGMFDVVVIDETQQMSTAAMMPFLFRARRALIIGDPSRRRDTLPASDERIRRAREQAGISAAWLEDRRLTYQSYSAYDAALRGAGESVLLDEHTGTHPSIARIFDDHFYHSSLTVLTDLAALRRATDPETGQTTLLLWEDVHGKCEPGPNGGSWRNQAEIDRVVWAVNELRDQLPVGGTVGVMTPFRAQAEELRALLRFGSVQVGTAEDFERDMCDAMVLSLVAGEDTPTQTVRWVGSQTCLLNAALSRARSHVVTVGDHTFWSRQAAAIPAALAKVSSVRSFHVAPIPPDNAEPGIRPDALAEMFYDRLVQAGFTQIERDPVLDGYQCDFLIGGAGSEGGAVAVLLDRGRREGIDAARHLRLMLLRRRLLRGALPGTASGTGLPATEVDQVLRLPAWRIRSSGPIPGLID